MTELKMNRSARRRITNRIEAHVRIANCEDAMLLTRLIKEMAHHHRARVSVTDDRLRSDGFGALPKFQALIAEIGTDVAGYALVCPYYSLFRGTGLFLEDLFVRDGFRKNGVATVLLSHVAALAVASACFEIVLDVLDWNKPALRFFERAGPSVMRPVEQRCGLLRLSRGDSRAAAVRVGEQGCQSESTELMEEAMAGIEKVSTLTIAVKDQQEALEWFTSKLEFAKRTDLAARGCAG